MQRRMILIVDDNLPSADTMELALMDLDGFETSSALNGARAWSLIQEFQGDRLAAVVTDLHMPAMDGFELISRIRSESRYSQLPIVVVSATTDPNAPQRVLDLGANAFIPKPWSPLKLRRRLEHLLYGESHKRNLP
jgi:CheY-like chemotaxis protein